MWGQILQQEESEATKPSCAPSELPSPLINPIAPESASAGLGSLAVLLSDNIVILEVTREGVEVSLSCSRILQEFPVTVLWPNIPAGPFSSLGNTVSSLFPGSTRLWHWEFTVSKAAPGAGAAGIPCPSE